ncbi:MAG: MarR family transcriptional regulator [bacterium]
MTDRKEIITNIGNQFQSLKRKMMALHCFDDQKFHITPAQWHVLFVVRENDGISSKEIAINLNISSSAATQLIDSLVAKDFLVRESDSDDRRALKIHLSDSSKSFVSKMKSRSFERLDQIFKALSDEELEKYFVLNQKIVENFLIEKSTKK